MGWWSTWWRERLGVGHVKATRAHPQIARHLSLTLTTVPTEVRVRDELSCAALLTSISRQAVAVKQTSWAATLLWDAAAATVISWTPAQLWDASAADAGEMALWRMMGKAVTLNPGDSIDLLMRVDLRGRIDPTVRSIADIIRPFTLRTSEEWPLLPGAYHLQAGALLRLRVRGRTWDGWVLSPLYRIDVIESAGPAESG